MKKSALTGIAFATALSVFSLSGTAHAGLRWNGVEMNGLRWNGVEMNGLRWNGMRWNGMRWNGMRWNGTQLNGFKWQGGEVQPSDSQTLKVEGGQLVLVTQVDVQQSDSQLR